MVIRHEDFFRIFLIAWLIGALISGLLHLLIPDTIAAASLWNVSIGWQREIGLWNVGIIFTVVYALFLKNDEVIKFVTFVLIVLSAILGSNHLFELISSQQFALINFLGVIINYFAVGFGIYAFILNKEKPFKR